ncbi:unnamed protein product [marine sediment metagenome]|uniref:Uncharacterized protein n=1 Tax=marine sediment metagenome TaxID=412755 RepID=X0WTR4_9ZZZZ
MENKPTYRKVGIGLGTMGMLYVMKPETYLELVVVGAIWNIAIVVILTTWNLDKEKNSETKNINHPINLDGSSPGLQPGSDVGAVPGRTKPHSE